MTSMGRRGEWRAVKRTVKWWNMWVVHLTFFWHKHGDGFWMFGENVFIQDMLATVLEQKVGRWWAVWFFWRPILLFLGHSESTILQPNLSRRSQWEQLLIPALTLCLGSVVEHKVSGFHSPDLTQWCTSEGFKIAFLGCFRHLICCPAAVLSTQFTQMFVKIPYL